MKKTLFYGGLVVSFLFVLCLPLAAETTSTHSEDLFSQGLYEEAIAAYEVELEMADDPVLIYNNIATVYYLIGDIEQAIHYFQLAAELAEDGEPDFAIPWINLAMLYELAGDLDATEESYLKATASTEPMVALNGYLGSAMVLFAKEDPHGAIEKLKESLARIEGETHPTYQEIRNEVYYTLGYVYASIWETEAALNAFAAATQTEPESPVPWMYLGAFLEDTGMYEQALLAYQEVLTRDSDDLEDMTLAQEMYDSLYAKLETASS